MSGEHERHLAVGALAQQGSQVAATLAMLAAITVLARRLSLSEFGAYGLLVSFTTYLLFAQRSVELAAIKAFAEAVEKSARDRAFSTAVSLYVVVGFAAGGLIAGVGTGVLAFLNIPVGLRHEARLSVFALGVVTAVGWPLKVFQDVLRGTQQFVAAAVAEAVAFMAVGGTLVALGLANASLWVLVAAGASVPFATGVASAAVVWMRRMPYRFKRHAVGLAAMRGFAGVSAYLFLAGIADLVVYSLDRVVLGAFRPVAAVGLYEGPVRAHNLVQTTHSALITPVVSASASYTARQDAFRTRELLLRGSRYTLAAVVPMTIVLMILAKPILSVWLGTRFSGASTAMIILVSYWLVNGSTGVAGRMLIAVGRARTVAVNAGAVAVVNLLLSLVLTPSLGLNGVVLGTTIAYVLSFPFFVWIILSTFSVRLPELAREVWLPAYSTGLVMGAGLLVVRISVELDSVPALLAAGAVAVLAYGAIYYAAWLRPGERALVRSLVPSRRGLD